MKNLKIYIPVIVALMSSAGYIGKEAWETSKETQYLKAKEELRTEFETKYETVIDKYIDLRADCGK